MRRYVRYRSFLDVVCHDRQQQGMTLLQVVFALAVFLVFGAVFLAVSEQLNLYFVADSSLTRSEKEEAPVPILLAERLSSALDRLVSVFEHDGADLSSLVSDNTADISRCKSISVTNPNLIELLGPNNNPASFSQILLDNAANKSEFRLSSRYEFCLYRFRGEDYTTETGGLYVLVAKPKAVYKTAVMLPVVRRIFCRPKPYCPPPF